MNFLNNLTSNLPTDAFGLYTNKSKSSQAASTVAPDNYQAPSAGVVNKSAKSAPDHPQNTEESAAKRATAMAKLTSDASIGQLQATEAGKQAGPKTPKSSEASEGTEAPGQKEQQKGPEGQKERQAMSSGGAGEAAAKGDAIRKLKKKQADILTATTHLENIKYSYVAGPDDKKYIKGYKMDYSQGGKDKEPAGAAYAPKSDRQELSPQEQEQQESIKERDQEIRQHEEAYKNSSDPATALKEAEKAKKAAATALDDDNLSSQDMAIAARVQADIKKIQQDKEAEKVEEAEKDIEKSKAKEESNQADTPTGVKEARANNNHKNSDTLFTASPFSQQVLGAYATAKSAFTAQGRLSILT